MRVDLRIDELERFGIRLEDEGVHAFDPTAEWWNESWFFDFFEDDGRQAGHVRLGLFPSQGRAWLWIFAMREGEWVAIEEPRLPLALVGHDPLRIDAQGLHASWEVKQPLVAGRLRAGGLGRVVSGARAGRLVPVSLDLEIEAVGPPHSGGRAAAPGHASATHRASRFEQPISARGTLELGGEARRFVGRGERDHSFGPRAWGLEWTFLVLCSDALRVQAAEAVIPNVGRFVVGYLQRDAMRSLRQAAFELTLRDDDVAQTARGPFSVVAEDGERVAGHVETWSGVEIDLSHTLVPPRPTLYRRCLVRATLDGVAEPLLGWLELHRLRQPR
jgi:hypothetical protein